MWGGEEALDATSEGPQERRWGDERKGEGAPLYMDLRAVSLPMRSVVTSPQITTPVPSPYLARSRIALQRSTILPIIGASKRIFE